MGRPASKVCRVVLTGSLAPFAEAYSAELRARGYAPLTMVNQVRLVDRLSRWLDAGGLGASELTGDLVEEFLVGQRADGRARQGLSRPGLMCLLAVVRARGVLAVDEPAPASSPTEVLLASFERYLLSERGLGAGTVGGYVRHARWFLQARGAEDVSGLTARDVTAAVLCMAGSGVSASAARYFVCGLRAFLRFCFVDGLVAVDLSQAAMLLGGRRGSSLPKGIGRADGVALLTACDRRSRVGRRDYALIILLLRLGLRRGEVAALRLDDIDWRAGELTVRGKRGREDRLPLPADVGEAIAAYLKRGRPLTDRREVFFRARAPYRPIDPATVSSSVRRACQRAGIVEIGPHRLRHTTACEMVSAEVPRVQLGQVLRHHSLQSTAIYARVNVKQLRLLAQPWPTAGAQQ